MRCHPQWNGTIDSLNQKPKNQRPRTMTRHEIEQYILELVESTDCQRTQINYGTVQAHAESELKQKVPIRSAKRYAFIGAINGSQPIASMTFTPGDRNCFRIKGMVNEWIADTLAPEINRLLMNNLHLICDKSGTYHHIGMTKAFRAGNCYSIKEILYILTAAAKYLSPLNNPPGHSLKDVIRSQHSLVSKDIHALLSEMFYSLTIRQIQNALL